MTMLVAKRDQPEERLLVFFPEEDVGVPNIKQYVTLRCPV